MSDDLIKRSDAIDAIELVDWYHQNRNKDMVHGANSDEHQAWYKSQDIYEALENIPSADRPQGWILCSERSPEENGEYLITLEFAWGREVEVGLWADGMWWNDNSHVNVAWMPLPEPWKGADNEASD